MKDYIKYLLSTLIFLWLLGFWYMIEIGNSSNSSMSSRNRNGFDLKLNPEDDDSNQNEIDIYVNSNKNDIKIQLKMLNRIKKIEKELEQLDLRNKENDYIIKNLRFKMNFKMPL